MTSTYVSAVHRRLQMQQKSRRIKICLELCQSGKITSCLVEGKLIADKQTLSIFITKTRRNPSRNSEEVLFQPCPVLALIGSKFAHQCHDRPVFRQKKVTRVCIELV